VRVKKENSFEACVANMVTAHNEYVGAVAGNAEHINQYNTTLLPNVLESIDELEQFLVADIRSVLKSLANAVDPTSGDYTEYREDLKLLHDRVDQLEGKKEYVPPARATAADDACHLLA
jgi:hypothetical protein